MTFLGALAPLMNGAAVQVFPGDASPVNFIATLVNYPQTRKSQNRKLVKILADALDAHVAALAEEAVSRSLSEQGDAGQHQADTASAKRSRLRVASSTITCFTPEVFFERFSGDFQQLHNADDLGVPDGPLCHSHLFELRAPVSISIAAALPLCATPRHCDGAAARELCASDCHTIPQIVSVAGLTFMLLSVGLFRAGTQCLLPLWPHRKCGRSVCHLCGIWPHR